MWHNVLAKLRHMGARMETERGETERRERVQVGLVLPPALLKHCGNLGRSAVKEVYMINVRQECKFEGILYQLLCANGVGKGGEEGVGQAR